MADDDQEQCPMCSQLFPLTELLTHAPTCDGSVTAPPAAAPPPAAVAAADPDADAAEAAAMAESLALAQRLQAEEEAAAKMRRTDEGDGDVTSGVEGGGEGGGGGGGGGAAAPGGDAAAAATAPEEEEDPSLALARQLQREEEEAQRAASAVKCEICKEPVHIDLLFVLDDCSHKFCKTCIADYIKDRVARDVGVRCARDDCDEMVSVRDIKELLGESLGNGPPGEGAGAGAAAGGARRGPSKGQQEHKRLLDGEIPTSGTAAATERLMAEMKHIMASDPAKNGYKVKPIDDNLYAWQIKLFDFDKKEPLAKDLAKSRHKHVEARIVFPQSYPFAPPYVRIIRPRFAFRTGHVTLGGSICMEMLTNQGWSPANTVEAIIVSIRAQLIAGNARLDPKNTSEYSTQEAKEAFERMMATHGWH